MLSPVVFYMLLRDVREKVSRLIDKGKTYVILSEGRIEETNALSFSVLIRANPEERSILSTGTDVPGFFAE